NRRHVTPDAATARQPHGTPLNASRCGLMEGCRWLVALDKNECYYEYRKKRKSVSTPAAQRRDGLLEQVKTRRNAYADLSPALLAGGEDDVGVDFKGKGCAAKAVELCPHCEAEARALRTTVSKGRRKTDAGAEKAAPGPLNGVEGKECRLIGFDVDFDRKEPV